MNTQIIPTQTASETSLKTLCNKALACDICSHKLPLGPKPIFQIDLHSRILIASQAPGSFAHRSGIPFMDKSGERLRAWMGVSEADFYNPKNVAIVPMGFCYPGKAKSGDVPPMAECAPKWQSPFLAHLPNVRLKLLIGLHSQRWHLGAACKKTLTETVRHWGKSLEVIQEGIESDNTENKLVQIPLPHPSPRNNIWLAKNPWFENELVPLLQAHVARLIKQVK